MKYLKQHLKSILALIFIDQFSKIIIHSFFFNNEVNILGNILRFHPIQNTNLSWGGNYISFLSSPVVTIIINLLVIALFISGYSYYRSNNLVPHILSKIIFVAGITASFCSLIDKVFWGGSIDFMQIPNLFTFDIKDCYLSVALCIFIFIGVKYNKEISVTEYLKWCLRKK